MVGKLQDLFINLFEPWIVFVSKIKEKTKYNLITVCFIVEIILSCIVRYGLNKESYIYNTLIGIFILFIITILSLDKSLKRVHWRRSMCIAWFGMCLVFTISDIFIPKKICGLGIILAFIFTGVFFVWQNHTRKDLLWKCFKDAVKILFWISAFVSFLFRPLYQGGRYAGIFTNPNIFAFFMFLLFAIYMSDLDWIIETGRDWKKNIMTYIGFALVLFFLSKTEARTSMLTCICIFVMWLIFRIYLNVKNQNKTKIWSSFIKNLVFSIVFVCLLYPIFNIGLKNIPHIVGHPIIFEDEPLFLANGEKIQCLKDELYQPQQKSKPHPKQEPSEEIVAEYESEGIESVDNVKANGVDFPEGPANVIERFIYVIENTQGLNALTSGRIDIYKGYMKKLNYIGHKNISLKINGFKKDHAHNNWLQFGYTYGVFGMFFYAIITVLGLGFSLKFYLKNRRKNATYAFLIPAICLGFVVATISECIFLPFEMFPAFAYWFAFGDLFVKNVAKNKFLVDASDK